MYIVFWKFFANVHRTNTHECAGENILLLPWAVSTKFCCDAKNLRIEYFQQWDWLENVKNAQKKLTFMTETPYPYIYICAIFTNFKNFSKKADFGLFFYPSRSLTSEGYFSSLSNGPWKFNIQETKHISFNTSFSVSTPRPQESER